MTDHIKDKKTTEMRKRRQRDDEHILAHKQERFARPPETERDTRLNDPLRKHKVTRNTTNSNCIARAVSSTQFCQKESTCTRRDGSAHKEEERNCHLHVRRRIKAHGNRPRRRSQQRGLARHRQCANTYIYIYIYIYIFGSAAQNAVVSTWRK